MDMQPIVTLPPMVKQQNCLTSLPMFNAESFCWRQRIVRKRHPLSPNPGTQDTHQYISGDNWALTMSDERVQSDGQ